MTHFFHHRFCRLALSAVLSLSLGLLAKRSYGQSGAWTTGASMPTGLQLAAAGMINGTIYVAGGISGSTASASLQAYNPTTNTWTNLAPMPATRYEGDGAGVINGLLYVPGGWTSVLPNSNLYVYNPSTNAWSSLATMPALSGGGATGVINNKLYVISGDNGYSGFYGFLYSYDPVANSWTTLPSSPDAHTNPAAGVINGKFYVAGGVNSAGSVSTRLDVYDPVANSWTTLAAMPTAVQGAASVVANNLLYVLGGTGANGLTSAVQIYNPATNVWTAGTSLPTVLGGAAAAAGSGSIYVLGGSGSTSVVSTTQILSAPAVTTIVSADPRLQAPGHLVTDGTYLFVSGTNANASDPNRNASSHQTIFRVPVGGGAATSLYPAFNPEQMAIIGTSLYWIDPNSGILTDTQILQAPKAGGGAVTAIYNQPSNQVIFDGCGLTTDGINTLYASDEAGGQIVKLNANGTGVTQVVPSRYSTPEQQNTLVLAGSTLYVADSGGSGGTARLQSVPASGGSVTTLRAGVPFVQPAGVAVGGGMIYVSDPGANNTIWQMPQAGGTPTALIAGAPFKGLGDLIYYGGSLYVADNAGNAIYQVTPGVSGAAAPVTTPPVATAPLITTSPVNQTVTVGSTAVFSVAASGTAPLTFQWYQNGAALTGATNPTLSISNVQSTMAGTVYSVTVTNSAGSATANAVLNVVSPPAILTLTPSQTGTVGQSVTFSVTASGADPLSFQWYFNGSAIAGATSSFLTLSNVQASNSGNYSVVVSNAYGSATSTGSTLTITSVLSPVLTSAPLPLNPVPNGSSSYTLTVSANSSAATYQWNLNGVAIPGATTSTYTVPVNILAAGTYTCTVTGANGVVTVSAGTLAVATNAWLSNLSARAYVQGSQNVLVAGFVTTGPANKSLLIRGDGPALGSYGVSNYLPDPKLTLFNGSGTALNSVTSWDPSLQSVFAAVGASPFPSGSNDTALLQSFSPGAYSAQIASASSATSGVALAEVYDADSTAPTNRLINISARAFVGTGSNVLIGGFVIGSGTSGATSSETVLIRGIGPGLTTYGIVNPLAQPVLTLYNSSGSVIMTFRGWGNYSNAGFGPAYNATSYQAATSAIFSRVGAFNLATGSADSAFVVTLAPGAYTASVTSQDGVSTGIALVEIYELR